jgi:hypothetical protein
LVGVKEERVQGEGLRCGRRHSVTTPRCGKL